MKTFFSTVLSLFLLLLTTTSAPAETVAEEGLRLLGDGPHYLNLAVGTFEGFDDQDNAFIGQLEWRFGKKLYYVGPLIGAMSNSDGGVIGFAGIYLDLALGRFVLSPQTGVGAYEKGSSKDLGGTLEFISGLGLSYQFTDGSRLGVRYEHISNANLHNENPGADLLLLNYGLAF